MFLHTRTGCVKPQLSNRVVPGPKRAGDQPTIRVRVRSRGTEREAARTDRMGRLVTLNVCGSHGDLGGVMGSYCYVVRPYNTGSVRAIR